MRLHLDEMRLATVHFATKGRNSFNQLTNYTLIMSEEMKEFTGRILRSDETTFEGQDGGNITGKNCEMLLSSGNRGVKFYAPSMREGYALINVGAQITVWCTMRVRDDGSLKYTMSHCQLVGTPNDGPGF